MLLPCTAWVTYDNTDHFLVDLAVEDVVGRPHSSSARGNSSSRQWREGETPNADIPTITVEPSVVSSDAGPRCSFTPRITGSEMRLLNPSILNERTHITEQSNANLLDTDKRDVAPDYHDRYQVNFSCTFARII